MSNQRLNIIKKHISPYSGLSSLDQSSNILPSYNQVKNDVMIKKNFTTSYSELSDKPTRRAVIVTGARTPFVKSFGELIDVDAIGLGCSAVAGLLKKTKLNPEQIDEIIWGNVVLNTKAPNAAREIVIDLNLPKKIGGVTVSRACLSGLQAILQGVALIEHGDADCVIAGGSDSMSNAEITLPRNLGHALGKYQYGKKKGLQGAVQFFKDAGSPLTWLPEPPAIAERSTGKTMGYHADLMAEINKVSRESQDSLASLSHSNAARARSDGIFKEEIVPVELKNGKRVITDNLIRESIDSSKMSKLKPVFRKTGTVTAATSSALTDGASAVLIMSEEKAKQLGYPIDIVIESSSNTAIDPNPQLLLAPALAIPKALEKANINLDDIDIVEMHEAFAAQVLATNACLSSDEFARKKLNRSKAVGTIPPHKLNVNGGSIALGHPFSATGGRVLLAAINELRRSKKNLALLSICAAGGLGGAAVVRRRDL